MSGLEVKLRCTGCRAYRDFERVGERVVRCADCGKRHATESLYAVSEDEEADFDEGAGR